MIEFTIHLHILTAGTVPLSQLDIMHRLLLIALGISLLTACGKDKLETKPSIKIKSIDPLFVASSGTLTMEMEFADKEGDISNQLAFFKKRTNLRSVPTIRDSFSLQVSDYPKNPRGELRVTLYYQNHLVSAINPPNLGGSPPRFENDTVVFRLVLKDLAGNISDTVSTSPIVISRN